jgi:cell division transport system ATP-binding protein
MHARPSVLSGGQKQRVAIARAVITRPDLLIADEPTGNVDDRTALRLMHLFREMNRLGTTVLIATHNEQLVRQMRQPCLYLDNGGLTLIPPDQPSPLMATLGPDAARGGA